MKILFFGDSITDMGRSRTTSDPPVFAYGYGYPFIVASKLSEIDPNKYTVINRGVGGNRIVDLYARVKADVWNEKPDLIGILIGINDIWHELAVKNGVDIDRFERIYSMLIEETLEKLKDVKIVLFEPFVLKGFATEENFNTFSEIRKYAKVVKKLSEKFRTYFLPLQDKFDKCAAKYGAETYLYDGIHPSVAGATLIADSFIELFQETVK